MGPYNVTDFNTDDIFPVGTSSVGSLSHGAVLFYANTEHPPQSKILSYKNCSSPSVFAHLLEEEVCENELIGTDSDSYAVAYYRTAGASASLVRWTPMEGYDLKNIVIARSGQIQNVFWANEQSRSMEEPLSEAQPRFITFSEEVVDFCYENHISNYLQAALRLAKHCFPCLTNLSVAIKHDPEMDEEWLEILAQVRAQPEDLLAMYNDYTNSLLDAVPWPARNKIRLINDIV